MSFGYRAVQWSPGKRSYDLAVGAALAAFLVLFLVTTLWLRPEITAETALIRAFGAAALALLHLVLSIGPLARLDARFLPLLWNRRHLGVTMCCCALAHGALALFQFHFLADVDPLASLFGSTTRFASVADFPFQSLGFAALAILSLMAATSHDFWLAQLSAPVWKALHMGVYLAYALIVAHVALGTLQDERSPWLAGALALGVVWIVGLHSAAARRERRRDRELSAALEDGFVEVCKVGEIPEKRARVACLAGERLAVFRYDGKLSALSSVCQHQNGPLGEGRILDGCVTCPWHGYQYRPENGASPAPFTEKVPTFRVKAVGDRVLVDPRPLPPGAEVPPALCGEATAVEAAREFFVGYLPTPPAIVRFVRRAAAAVVALAAGAGFLFAAAQRPLGEGTFDFGKPQGFAGTVRLEPVPALWIEQRDGGAEMLALVGAGKRGASPEVRSFAGQYVRLSAMRIERHGQRLLEVVPGSIVSAGSAPASSAAAPPLPLGHHRLRGEIVDSKCYFGVMKPGLGKAHRDCAVRCIAGGSPPVLVVRAPDERLLLLFLVAGDGAALGPQLLDLVAEPVEVEGEVSTQGERLILTTSLARVRRLADSRSD